MSAFTSKVTLALVEAGCRRVTEETVPVPDMMHRALDLCCDNDNNFATMS